MSLQEQIRRIQSMMGLNEVSRRDLNQVYIRVVGPNGESIYGEIGIV